VALRSHIIDQPEKAEVCSGSDPERRKFYLSFVIIGGGFSGVELAGAYNNMRNLSDQYLQITNNRDYIDSNSLQKRSPESEICHVRPLPVLHGFHQSIHRRRLSPMRD
jgi:hypothetical protein